ncbi:MAG: hypothetical protein AAB897_00205 [Patescibacteria group bacterium]|mgnify:CR=1 FL=1
MSRLWIIIIIAVVAVSAGAGIFFFGTTRENLPQDTAPEPQPVVSATPQEEEPALDASPQPLTDNGATPLIKCAHEEFTVKILSVSEASPANLTVHVGDTVTFINEDDDLRWPGSDPHPTHSALPLFDALGGISTGQSFSYTFKAAGVVGWHDHLPEDPPTAGYITVLECSE